MQSGPKTTSEKAANLLNDWQDISFIQIATILLLCFGTIWLLRKTIPFLAERVPSRLRLYLLRAVPILRMIIIISALLWIIPIIFNITVQNFLVIAGAASVAIGFAFKDYVSSLIAGIVAIFERPYGPGDWVEIEGDYGEVINLGMRAIRIRTATDDIITVPHDAIWSNNISNSNTGSQTLMCVADFYLDPHHDAAKVRRELVDVALTSAYLDFRKPVLVVLKETEFATRYSLKAYPFDLRDQFKFVSDLTDRGKGAIRDAGAKPVSMPHFASEDVAKL
ncbi:mechanosensitive ion channel protein MscS [Algimonas arctica]|uniref:Small-conductance mechanosensitive channel n=1 Tax=Algimonas arctica TaxID=1479486 RepID=A0A8J3CNU4_9PROT|nr:mechanosensitive ion channel domain-containing protein [Algimonas arctica]GHA89638.1 mechanosensitive ion channel protein MscS [Algimonas arctica]